MQYDEWRERNYQLFRDMRDSTWELVQMLVLLNVAEYGVNYWQIEHMVNRRSNYNSRLRGQDGDE
jgi:hypothetical protein